MSCFRPLLLNYAAAAIGSCAVGGEQPPVPFDAAAAFMQGAGAPANVLAIRAIARREAEAAGLPYDLVDAVIKVESDYQTDRIGAVGEIGLMQVRPGTAAMLGFHGSPSELADPAVNIHYGASYLGQAWRLTGGNTCRTLMKYRAGHGEEIMSVLSVSYCARARAHLSAMGSALAVRAVWADAPAVPSLAPIPSAARPRNSKEYWVRFEARIRTINAAIEARWRRLDARAARVSRAE